MHMQVDIGGITGMDMAITHDSPARRSAVAAVVYGRRITVVRMICPAIVPHFVGDDDYIPVSVAGGAERMRKTAIQESGDAVGGKTGAGVADIGDPAVLQVAPSAEQMHDIIGGGVFIVVPVTAQRAKVIGAEWLAAGIPDTKKLHQQPGVDITLVDIADSSHERQNVTLGKSDISEHIEE